MEDRLDKVSKYLYSPLNSQNLHLQSEVRMLEERLKNLEYLKQTYERSARDKSLELDSLANENFNLKSQLLEKSCRIDELTRQLSINESKFQRIIEELRTSKSLLEQEISEKSNKVFDLQQTLQEHFEKNLKLIDENQIIRRDLKEKERQYSGNVLELENRLKDLSSVQKLTEQRVNKILYSASPKKRGKVGRKTGKKEDIEERLLKSEKKIKELESALASTSKTEGNSLGSSGYGKMRSASQSIRNKKFA